MDGESEALRLIAEERERKTGRLDLGNLGLSELPKELFQLTHLTWLNLGVAYTDASGGSRRSSNQGALNVITSIPGELGCLRNLKEIHLRILPIRNIELFASLTGLRSLDCLGAQVADLSPLAKLSNLQSLNCSYTLVVDLSPLTNSSALHSLDSFGTQVADLSPLAKLSSLQSLNCSYTSVVDLSPLTNLSALQSLDCSDTQVADLSPLAKLSALQSLRCWKTKVADLSPLAKLSALQSLRCWKTKVADLSPLAKLSALQSLDCSQTQVTDLSPLANLSALRSLNCSGTQATDLSPLAGLSALRSLYFSSTQVADLSPLGNLSALQSLYCSHTQVADLSPLANLSALQSLNCSYTQVADLSPIANLSALQSLYFSSTQVADLLPLANLSALQSLNCSYTQVADLSPLGNLSALQSLDCSSTQVADLSPIVGLDKLDDLRALNSALADFPRLLAISRSLETLVLSGTTLTGVPAEILSKDIDDNCLQRLRDHLVDLEAGTGEVREAKLVVLGNGRVGKTQICRQIRGLVFDERVRSTHGITVTSQSWKGPNGDETLNVWDFGGQDIYHGAHALFMKTGAVFLVVWNPAFETKAEETADGTVFRNYPLPYWLEYVRTLGRSGAPIVVVQTRCERPDQDARRLPVEDRLLEQLCWPKHLAYSAKTRRGQGTLNDAISDAIASLRQRDGIATIGVGRLRVLKQLEAWRDEDQARAPSERQHRTLSREEFVTLCERQGGVRSPDSLLDYLHNLGVVFHQPNLFADRIILDQSWALDAIYAVFDRQDTLRLIKGQSGRFTQSLLAMTVWQEHSEKAQHLFLSLMLSCGIAFTHRKADKSRDVEAEYIAPDLLPPKDAVKALVAARWDHTADRETGRLVYEYSFLHPGLMRALVCDVGERSGEAGVYWKYGIWAYETSTRCQTVLEQEILGDRRGRITLRLMGPHDERLAKWLRERMDARNRLFGYADLCPAVDMFPAPIENQALERQKTPLHSPDDPTGVRPLPEIAREPVFGPPPPLAFASRDPEVFVSYAWADDTPEGQTRGKLVDDLCAALDGVIKVRRDRDEMRPGALISEFMTRLTEADFVILVISNKYLRSEYCMYELFRLWRSSADRPQVFLRRVVPLILPDANLGDVTNRFQRAIYWREQVAALEPLIANNLGAVGSEVFRKFTLMSEFARNTSDILEHLVDKLMPRDFERMAAEGFREIVDLVRRRD